ncbi:d280fc85-b23d-4eb0-808a-76158f30e43d [Sclerotinia trifoliorum]|uniref:D280fc85-b23d-4eb0-808a-76158f30e43d n=1 Tax=Sclerotinia trifoliorum TaxID=28548 RepID=A0A8H2VWH1_9HELO|nr:d280fc85-b23d-4eb0-808a-76158f30e43d [Sclerotinia trifoliorum]
MNHPFVFDNGDGDVGAKVLYEGCEVSFKLSSHALSFASPVWKKLIFPPFPLLTSRAEGEESNSKKSCVANEPFSDIELDFTEDNPEALLVLLRIAYLQFSAIPSSLPYVILDNIAILCDKYNCILLVKPWLKDWLKDEQYEAYLPRQEGWLWIAYCFGRRKLFYDLMNVLVLSACLNDDNECFIVEENSLRISRTVVEVNSYPLEEEGCPLPPGMAEILALRAPMINRLLQSLHFIMDGLLSHSAASTCKLLCEETCRSVIFGLLARNLNAYGLWPIPDAETLVESPYQLYTIIQSSFSRARTAHQAMKIPHIRSTCRTLKYWSGFIHPFERDIAFFSLSDEKRIHAIDETQLRFRRALDRAVEDIGLLDFPGDSSRNLGRGLRADILNILQLQRQEHGSHNCMKNYAEFDDILESVSE